ncbi:MAG: FAD-dependent oxidoreductase [Patescibacteria group bacterium]
MVYDLIIVGGAAAGMTAAIYATRRALKTVVLTQDIGGQAATTPDIENYPGFSRVDGLELMQKFQQQAVSSGAEFAYGEVTSISRQGDTFAVRQGDQEYRGRAVILAYGLTHRHIGAPGEDTFTGKGVSYCATCDAPLYRGKDVAVVGGGNSALDAALLLSKIARRVYLLVRNDRLRGEAVLISRVQDCANVTVLFQTTVKSIDGTTVVERITVADVSAGQDRPIAVSGVFVEIGFQVRSDLVKDLVQLDANSQIVVSPSGETSVPGIFAAGDVTNTPYKQIVISAGEGAKAALQAYQYLNGGKPGGVDWGLKKK